MMPNITVYDFRKMKHSLHDWWIKNSLMFSEIGGSHSLRRRLWKTVYFECAAVKSGRILPTFAKNLLLQSSWPWRNVSKCDVITQEAVFWVMISAKDERNTYCSNNVRVTYHCHFGEAVEFVQITRHSNVGCLNQRNSLSLTHLATLPTSFQPSDQRVYPPLQRAQQRGKWILTSSTV
jgi:hypothetical protein